MLKAMRKNAKIFMWLLIAAFVLWLAADVIISGQGSVYAGTIFGRKVSLNEFKRAWDATRVKAMITYGDEFRNVVNTLNMENEAWDRLILLHEAKRQRIKTNDKEVVNFIKEIPIFKDKGGAFDRRSYEYILKYTFGIAPRQFEEQIREELTINKLLAKRGVNETLSEEDILKEYKLVNEKAQVSYIVFEAEKYYSLVTYTEQEVKEYFEKNREKFTIPALANVEYFGLDFPDETAEAKEKVKKEILEIYADISATKDFVGTAKKYSLHIKETGFFAKEDKIPQIGFALNFATVALSLKPQEISRPIETKGGIYILRVKEKKEARQSGFAEAKDRAERAVRTAKGANLALADTKEALSKIKAAMEGRQSFEGAAANLSLKIDKTEAFTRSTYIKGLGVAGDFINAAFSLKEGEVFAEPAKVHNGYCILKLNDIVPIDENKYAQEKEKFKEQLLAQKRYVNFLTWFYDLKKRAKLKSNLENLAAKK